MFKTLKETGSNKAQSSTKVRHVLSGLISVTKAAFMLGVNSVTVTRWCESGKLPAMARPFGQKTTYKIPLKAVELLIQEQEVQSKKAESPAPVEHLKYISAWKHAMEKGLITGKPFSPLTIKDYQRHITEFFNEHQELSYKLARQVLLKCPVEQFGRKFKYHKALVSYAKFLHEAGQLAEEEVEGIKRLRPKPHKAPKRTCVNEPDLASIIKACTSLRERLLVTLLASTGVRAAEAATIQWQDINLEEGTLHIPKGKGGKERKLGLMPALISLIKDETSSRARIYPAMALLVNAKGKPMDRYAIYRKLKRIGGRIGINAHPHALRRAFVTINANKGRSLVILQRSCGHSDIKTTMSYCLTAEQEVIEAMKGWD